ncbi:IS701 family transposase [Streptomyces sp. NPDC127084]|uniref:IS701 family transposase n=1 Tax=Streptomyces sp. NPDC127084 TaxID=3347133 RepID=UPI00365CAE65
MIAPCAEERSKRGPAARARLRLLADQRGEARDTGDARPARDTDTEAAEAALVKELAAVLFASFTRKDQREKGEQYLNGLLRTHGRKSIRRIAAAVGGPAAEQSLHHFICSSTWEWMPVREALAAYLEDVRPSRAWVVRSMPIPKAGKQSVGVDRMFDPCLGQAFNGQQAFGVWQASEAFSTPVHWRLRLPDVWVRDAGRRRRAEIPDGIGAQSGEECAAAALLESLSAWRMPVRPVVLHPHISDLPAIIGRFTRAGIPVIAQVADAAAASPLTVRAPALPGYGGGPRSARAILDSVRGLRGPVEWTDLAAPSFDRRTSLAVAVPVGPVHGSYPVGTARAGSYPVRPVLPGPRHAANAVRGGDELVLLGEWADPRQAPVSVWATNMTSVPASALLRLTKLADRTSRDLADVGERVGLKDFEGRSFRGWHRHLTLASTAHAVAALAGRRDHRATGYASRSA